MYAYGGQTERPQPGASLTRQRRPSYNFCPNKRLRRVRAVPRTCEGCGANPGLRKADLFPFAASDFGVSRAPSEGHAPVFIFVVVRSLSRVVENTGRCLLITLRYCMGTRFHEGLGKRNNRTEFSYAFPPEPSYLGGVRVGAAERLSQDS